MNIVDTTNNKRKLILSLVLLTSVVLLGTFAWYVWSSKDNTSMNVTIGDLADVSFKTGNDINVTNLSPSFNYDDGALTEFSIRKKKGLTTDLYTNIYLDITSISDTLKSPSFKYELLSSSDGNTYNNASSGNFQDASIGKLNILVDTPLTDGKTYYKLYIWIDGNEENNTSMQSSSMKGVLNVNVTTHPVNAVTLVEGLDEGATGDSGSGVYKVQHDAIASGDSATGSEIPAVTDYRYYGADPSNYICLDMEGQSTCPDRGLYRIIGSIYEENAGQNLVKVIKATTLTNGNTKTYAWDSGNNNIWATITNGTYSNNQISGSNVMKLLNSGDWWKGTNNYLNYSLTEKSKSKVNVSRFYLGGDNSSPNTQAIYEYERGTKKYNNDRPLYWDGYVGLMYPSDYGYAAGITCATETSLDSYSSSCKLKDWLFNSSNWQWFMTPNSNNPSFVWVLYSTGSVYNNLNINTTGGVTPVFYLSPTTSIKSGKGTYTAPYILS